MKQTSFLAVETVSHISCRCAPTRFNCARLLLWWRGGRAASLLLLRWRGREGHVRGAPLREGWDGGVAAGGAEALLCHLLHPGPPATRPSKLACLQLPQLQLHHIKL